MRATVSVLALIVAASLLFVVPTRAEVYNVDLAPVGDSEVSGAASTIVGAISGPTPFYNVEVNVRLSKMPPMDMVYEGWLVDNETNYKHSLGAFSGMRLSSSQRLLRFADSAPYDAVAVSLEPAQDVNPMPAMVVALGSLPGSEVSAADFTQIAVLPEDETFQRQMIVDRFRLSDQQVTDLRMRGWNYPAISMVANAGLRSEGEPSDIAAMLERGQTWEQIAQSYNTTVALLLEPVPVEAVAGFVAEARPAIPPPAGMIQVPVVYQRYPNGLPIVTQRLWDGWRKRGYSWRDVAVAANIANMTGERVDDLLRMVRIQGRNWGTIALNRGLHIDRMKDTSRWPFSRNGEAMMPAWTEQPPSPPAAAPPSGPTY